MVELCLNVSLCLQHFHNKQCEVQIKLVVVQWEYVKTILCLQCFHNKWNEYLRVHLMLKITFSLKLEHYSESMLNKIGDWIKGWLIFSWRITCFRCFLSSFTGEYYHPPDTVLKGIISLVFTEICTLSVALVKKEGGGIFFKKI